MTDTQAEKWLPPVFSTLFVIGSAVVLILDSKMKRGHKEKCHRIVEERGGTVTAIEKEYHPMTRGFSYRVKWMTSDGAVCGFRYQPSYPIFTKESITEL